MRVIFEFTADEIARRREELKEWYDNPDKVDGYSDRGVACDLICNAFEDLDVIAGAAVVKVNGVESLYDPDGMYKFKD
jgi:hypothetical protein